MKFVITLVINLICINLCFAQSSLTLQAGWTMSSVRVTYPDHIRLSSAANDMVDLGTLQAPYVGGLIYEYNYRKLCLSTGVSFMIIGAKRLPNWPDAPWKTYYWVVPLLVGYPIELPHNFGLKIQGGVDMGIQQGGNGLIETGVNRFNINAVVGVEGSWKRFRLGVRGQLGLTNYRTYSIFTYKHTALTTYLGYTLWDHAQCKARRLKKLQEKNLD